MSKQGVVIIAAGHAFYGCYAHNLCMSIKSVDPTIKVALAHADGGIGHISTYHIFDQLIDIPKEYIYTNGLKDYLKAKVYLYDLSPFDETIFIDADVIWCPQKPIKNMFDALADTQFTCSNRGRIEIEKAEKGFIQWADPKEIQTKYALKNGAMLYNLASEFIYFKKNKEVKKLFGEAKKFYENPLISFTRFSHGVPDELAFEIACMKTGIYPHIVNFFPFYWEHFEKKNMQPADIYRNYYGYSIGGNMTSKTSAEIYNNLSSHYAKRFGKTSFPCKDKRGWLPERSQI